MVEFYLDEIARKTGGKILQGSPSVSFDTFSIDSRSTRPGELFFALVARRDGHDFIPDAVNKGAAGAVICQEIKPPTPDVALVKVSDTLQALQNLAKEALSEKKIKMVGITGSIGKTTTKEFTSSLLSLCYQVLKSEGNYNNLIGLPLSILKLEDKHEVAVMEMGMSTPGEIGRLTQIAPPDLAVITNIKPVHLEFFNGVEEIASAKKEILEGLKPDGTAILNGDDPLVRKISKDFCGKKLFFGLSEDCHIRAQNIKSNGIEGITFELIYRGQKEKTFIPFFYTSFLYNFLAASAVALSLAVPLEKLLGQTKALKPLPKRGTMCQVEKDILLIDDSYNSNPAALESVLTDLARLPFSRKVAVLGDMLELGKQEAAFHIRAGKQVKNLGWDMLITVGPLARHMAEGALKAGMKKEQVVCFEDSEKASEKIKALLKPGDLVLVKGSRGMKTERIVERLNKKGS
jgi:UDP-N-acetylmuramoyl-tripeptide--D-alanyl-D-alanine ligase